MKSKQHQGKASNSKLCVEKPHLFKASRGTSNTTLKKRGFEKLGKAQHSIESSKPAATRPKLEALSLKH